MNNTDQIILLVTCPDQMGIVAKYTGLLYDKNVNVLTMEEHVEERLNMFFMRLVLDVANLNESITQLIESLDNLRELFGGEFQLFDSAHRPGCGNSLPGFNRFSGLKKVRIFCMFLSESFE